MAMETEMGMKKEMATEVQMAEIQAPELCGIIDVMLSVLQRGREVQSLAPPPRRGSLV